MRDAGARTTINLHVDGPCRVRRNGATQVGNAAGAGRFFLHQVRRYKHLTVLTSINKADVGEEIERNKSAEMRNSA